MTQPDACHHQWMPLDGYHACSDCDARCATCNVCGGPTRTSLLACQRCLDREAQMLTDIETALEHYQVQPRSLVPAVRYDKDRVHANSSGASGGDHVLLDLSDGPESVWGVLNDWVAMWTELSRDAQNVGPAEYLRGHLMWAAHHADEAAWSDYRKEMRTLRHRARRMAGLLPQVQAGACIYCGADVVRDWADEHGKPRTDGLSDDLRCARCHTTWETPAHWQFANRHTILGLPETHPEQTVTREDARAIFPHVPAATWRTWLFRDAKRAETHARWVEMVESGRIGPEPEPERMPVRGWDARGRGLYRLGDLTAHVDMRDRATQRKAG